MDAVRRFLVVGVMLAAAAAPVAPARAAVGPCPLFPADNVWHADVSGLPVHPRSAAWLAAMGGPDRRLHPDFGPSGTDQPYGIPYVVVPGTHLREPVSFEYADESDPGPYPISAATPIEGGSDAHALVVDGDACRLYELFALDYQPGRSTAGSGAVWDLRSNALRPAGWTSADAAGLPILAGLLRRDEVAAGRVDHAIRVTAQRTDRSYVWPARHQAGAAADPNLPPMGARFRLAAGFDVSRFRPDTQVVLRAMQRHGLILADNGSNWYFQGSAEPGWDTRLLDELKTVPAGAFEAVDASPLMVHPDSGQVRTPRPALPVTAPPATTVATRPPATTVATGPPVTASPPPPTTAAVPTMAASTTVAPAPPGTAPAGDDDGEAARRGARSGGTSRTPVALAVAVAAVVGGLSLAAARRRRRS